MTTSVRVKAKVIEDDSGIKSELPIIITEQGELSPVTDYLLRLEMDGRSATTINTVVQATRLLIDYMHANQHNFSTPKKLFQTFAKRLYTGTIGDDGLDPSGLYWIPGSKSTANKFIVALTGLTDWLANEIQVESMNPLIDASTHEQRLNYAAWFRKNQYNFLGHIEDKALNTAVRKARAIKGRTKLTPTADDAVAFPEPHWSDFFKYGLGAAKDPRVAMRDKLIVLLMHGGGLRESEAMTLWVSDVFEGSHDPTNAIVRIYDEEEGVAPDNWRGRSGSKNRKAYLKETYGLIPRKYILGTGRVGWKTRVVDHKDNYLQVQWFPSDYGKLFMMLWRDYQKYRASIECQHPYAFISFHPQHRGQPYTLNAFHANYSNALRRIGLKPNKSMGFDPHGHRHNYGRRLETAGLHPLVIRRCLHHKSLDSQLPYTGKSQEEVSRALSDASQRLNNPGSKIFSTDWKSLVEHGFDDIDPQGYFSGKHPKLGTR